RITTPCQTAMRNTFANIPRRSTPMGHLQPKGTDWLPLYEVALSETDAGKLPERIMVARSAIFDRIEESLTHPLPGEQRAMDDALRNLRRLAMTTTTPMKAA